MEVDASAAKRPAERGDGATTTITTMARGSGEPPAKRARVDEDEEADLLNAALMGSVVFTKWLERMKVSTTIKVLKMNVEHAVCCPSVERLKELLSDLCSDGRLWKIGSAYEDQLDHRVTGSTDYDPAWFSRSEALCVAYGIKSREEAELLETAGIHHLSKVMQVGVNVQQVGHVPNSVITKERPQGLYIVPVVRKFSSQSQYFEARAPQSTPPPPPRWGSTRPRSSHASSRRAPPPKKGPPPPSQSTPLHGPRPVAASEPNDLVETSHGPRSHVSRADIENLMHLTQAEACKHLKMSTRTLHRRCRELGLKRWPLHSYKQVSRADIENLMHLPRAEACKHLKICTVTLWKRCREFGLERWPYPARPNRKQVSRALAQEPPQLPSRNLNPN